MLDVKRLIGEVTAKNGIRLEPNDPAFAPVTLNQLVLEETVNRLLGQISATLAQFAESLSKGEHLAGKALAQEVKAAAIEAREEWATELQANAIGISRRRPPHTIFAVLLVCRRRPLEHGADSDGSGTLSVHRRVVVWSSGAADAIVSCTAIGVWSQVRARLDRIDDAARAVDVQMTKQPFPRICAPCRRASAGGL